MNSVELVKNICKERKIPISRLEKDCGFSNGYIRKLQEGKFPSDRLLVISEYLNLPVNYLMTGEESNNQTTIELTSKDKRDIKKNVDNIMESLESANGEVLYYDGVEITLTDDTKALLRNALTIAMQAVKIENKEKYNPHKNGK